MISETELQRTLLEARADQLDEVADVMKIAPDVFPPDDPIVIAMKNLLRETAKALRGKIIDL